ncbi:MAG: hypothetical protein ABSD49_09005 [Candidatus Bathyarchaeia archaeon]
MPKRQWLLIAIITVIIVAVFAYLILNHPIGSAGATSPSHSGYSL